MPPRCGFVQNNQQSESAPIPIQIITISSVIFGDVTNNGIDEKETTLSFSILFSWSTKL